MIGPSYLPPTCTPTMQTDNKCVIAKSKDCFEVGFAVNITRNTNETGVSSRKSFTERLDQEVFGSGVPAFRFSESIRSGSSLFNPTTSWHLIVF